MKAVFNALMAGTIQYVNPAFERISGLNSNEVIGRSVKILDGQYDDAYLEKIIET